jgi:rhodanese-related sulfurtransferase
MNQILAEQRVKLIAPEDLVHQKLRVVDVREPGEFVGELGHIPGAELVPLGSLARAAHGWDRNDEILVVCRSGGRSASAAATLTRLGFSRVGDLRGGMLAYNAARLPVTRAR